MQIRESGISFQFDSSWKIIRYDAHRYYQGLSGAGLKGVDFIGLREDRELFLFEVKNYHPRTEMHSSSSLWQREDAVEVVAEAVSRKFEDTLTACRAIHAYHHRKWLFRIMQNRSGLLRKFKPEWYFWSQVHRLVQHTDTLKAVCWIETLHPREVVQTQLLSLLKRRLQHLDLPVLVASCERHPFAGSLRAEMIRKK
ncbi:MAG: hypothetical protein R3350_08610 [Saprospiraceae bacterium]|nr:hypothetical protein [Saprospiraceae bacterium]